LSDYEQKQKRKVGIEELEGRYEFAKCRNNHIVGIIDNKYYYITDISEVQLLFPNCQYEDFDSRFW
jgi:hypothetical protein